MNFHAATAPLFTLTFGERSRLEHRFSANSRKIYAAAPLPVSRAQCDAARQQLKATMFKRPAPSPTEPPADWEAEPAGQPVLLAQMAELRAMLVALQSQVAANAPPAQVQFKDGTTHDPRALAAAALNRHHARPTPGATPGVLPRWSRDSPGGLPLSASTLRAISSATPTFDVEAPPSMVQQLLVHGGDNVHIEVHGGMNVSVGRPPPAVPTPSPLLGAAGGASLRDDMLSPDDNKLMFSPPSSEGAAFLHGLTDGYGYTEGAAAYPAYDYKAEAAYDGDTGACDGLLARPLEDVIASPALFAALSPEAAAAATAASLAAWSTFKPLQGAEPPMLDAQEGAQAPLEAERISVRGAPSEAPAPTGRSNQPQLDELGRWMALSMALSPPGRAHELTAKEKDLSLAGVRSYLRVSGKSGGKLMSAKCADRYVNIINNVTEPGGLAIYGIDAQTPGLSLFGSQLSSGLSGDSQLIRAVASSALGTSATPRARSTRRRYATSRGTSGCCGGTAPPTRRPPRRARRWLKTAPPPSSAKTRENARWAGRDARTTGWPPRYRNSASTATSASPPGSAGTTSGRESGRPTTKSRPRSPGSSGTNGRKTGATAAGPRKLKASCAPRRGCPRAGRAGRGRSPRRRRTRRSATWRKRRRRRRPTRAGPPSACRRRRRRRRNARKGQTLRERERRMHRCAAPPPPGEEGGRIVHFER